MENLNQAAATTELPNEAKTMAMIAHLGGLFFGFIPSLVIWLMNKDKTDAGSAFVTQEAKEALNFQIFTAILGIISAILTLVIIGLFMIPVLILLVLIFSIMGAVQVNKGLPYRYPLNIRFIA